jgi:afadin
MPDAGGATDWTRIMDDRAKLTAVIGEWNENRLDMFAMTAPDEQLEFTGVMRFFYKEAGARAVTKCVRVASSASTLDVIDCLVEKLRPDMRMLTQPQFALYEVFENGRERRLQPDEKPLCVQLAWAKNNLDPRFQLRDDNLKPELLGVSLVCSHFFVNSFEFVGGINGRKSSHETQIVQAR